VPRRKTKTRAKPTKSSKKPTTNGRPIHISFLLDETGSMQSCHGQAVSGFNEYITNMKKEKASVQMTFCTFNSEKKNIRFTDTPLAKVKPLSAETYRPDHMTPLLDAVGQIIKRTEETEAKAKKEKKDLAILFVILTDGQENASREFKADQIRDLIEKKQKEGWTFVYLGANQDAWEIGSHLGISVSNTMSYDSAKTGGVIGQSLAQASVMYSRPGGQQVNTGGFWTQAGIEADDDKKKKVKDGWVNSSN